MNSHDNAFLKLINVIRKDSGINNMIDAVEQLSLLLLVKYFYEFESCNLKCGDTPKQIVRELGRFLEGEEIKADFSALKYVLRSDEQSDTRFVKAWKKVECFLNTIPLRFQSEKVLRYTLLYLQNIDVYHPHLAKEYDELIIKMTNESLASGVYHSPKALILAIVQVVKPTHRQSIYDPALGTGRFIIEAKKLAEQNLLDNSYEPLSVFGKDVSSFACLIGTLNLLLNGIDIENISLGDSLLDNDTTSYDVILSAVPFGKASSVDQYEYYDGYSSNLEVMFLKHSMKKLVKGGKAALVVPTGILFSSLREIVSLRRELIIKFNLHSILSLPSGALGAYPGVKVCVLFFDNVESEDHLWFYQLKTGKPLNKKNQLVEDNFIEFVELFSLRKETENSWLVNKQDVLNRENVSLSVESPRKANEVSNFQVASEIAILDEEKQKFNLLLSKFMDTMKDNKEVRFVDKLSIGELFVIKSGKALNKDAIAEEGQYPVYGGNGIIGYHNEPNLNGENILIGRVGAQCGNVHFVQGPIWLTSNAFSVQLNCSLKVHLPYLAHVLRSLNLNKLARGSAQPSISYAKIKDVEIRLPTYEQQVELSKWFDDIQMQNDKLVEKIESQKDKLNELTNYSIVNNCIGLSD
jgi:type I restriction enzyme M protein